MRRSFSACACCSGVCCGAPTLRMPDSLSGATVNEGIPPSGGAAMMVSNAPATSKNRLPKAPGVTEYITPYFLSPTVSSISKSSRSASRSSLLSCSISVLSLFPCCRNRIISGLAFTSLRRASKSLAFGPLVPNSAWASLTRRSSASLWSAKNFVYFLLSASAFLMSGFLVRSSSLTFLARSLISSAISALSSSDNSRSSSTSLADLVRP